MSFVLLIVYFIYFIVFMLDTMVTYWAIKLTPHIISISDFEEYQV